MLLTLYPHRETAGDTDRSQIYHQLNPTVCLSNSPAQASLGWAAGRKPNPTFRVSASASQSVMSLQELIGSASSIS